MSTNPVQPLDTPPPSIRGHISALDGLRGLAILLVMVFHTTVFIPANTIEAAYKAVTRFGWIGVDLFFVLSGFLITGLLVDAKGKSRYFRTFYARRTLRIFPLYYGFLFIVLVAIPFTAQHLSIQTLQYEIADWTEALEGQHWYWLYLSNLSVALDQSFSLGIIGISWSLAIEEQFYLVWPALVFFLSPKSILRVCALAIALAFLSRCVLVGAEALGSDWRFAHPLAIYVLTFCRMDTLAIGAAIAILARRADDVRELLPAARRAAFFGCCLTLLSIGLDFSFGSNTRVPGDGSTTPGYTMQTIGYTSTAAAFGGILLMSVCARESGRFAKVVNARLPRMLGKYSYALYLFHNLISIALMKAVPLFATLDSTPHGGSRLTLQLIFTLMSIATSLAAAWLSWHLYEKQFLRLKGYFMYKDKALASSTQRPAVPLP